MLFLLPFVIFVMFVIFVIQFITLYVFCALYFLKL